MRTNETYQLTQDGGAIYTSRYLMAEALRVARAHAKENGYRYAGNLRWSIAVGRPELTSLRVIYRAEVKVSDTVSMFSDYNTNEAI